MGVLDINVERIDVQTVPKFVLFGGKDREPSAEETAGQASVSGSGLPVSKAQVVAVSVFATVLAIAAFKLAGLVDSKLNLNC